MSEQQCNLEGLVGRFFGFLEAGDVDSAQLLHDEIVELVGDAMLAPAVFSDNANFGDHDEYEDSNTVFDNRYALDSFVV